jgi:hypothetical protein
VTDSSGKASRSNLVAPDTSGAYNIQAHYAGDVLYKAKDLTTVTLTVN